MVNKLQPCERAAVCGSSIQHVNFKHHARPSLCTGKMNVDPIRSHPVDNRPYLIRFETEHLSADLPTHDRGKLFSPLVVFRLLRTVLWRQVPAGAGHRSLSRSLDRIVEFALLSSDICSKAYPTPSCEPNIADQAARRESNLLKPALASAIVSSITWRAVGTLCTSRWTLRPSC